MDTQASLKINAKKLMVRQVGFFLGNLCFIPKFNFEQSHEITSCIVAMVVFFVHVCFSHIKLPVCDFMLF